MAQQKSAKAEESDLEQQPNNDNSNEKHTYTQTTPDNGRVVFEDVPIGEYTVSLSHPEYEAIEATEVLDEDGRAPIYELEAKPKDEAPEKPEQPSTPTADFVVNAITAGGEWKVDGIEDTEIQLTLEKKGNQNDNEGN